MHKNNITTSYYRGSKTLKTGSDLWHHLTDINKNWFQFFLFTFIVFQMTHASIEEKERVALGVTDNLIRVSVGLEDVADIIEDLDNALKAVSG